MSRHIIVTGASRGIGRAVAQRFIEAGDNVTAWSRSGDAPEGSAIAASLDVADSNAVNEAAKTAIEQFGPVSAIVVNAGITRDGLAMRMSDEQWHEVVRTNLDGAFFCTRSVLPSMIKNRSGSVIFIGSVSPFLGVPGQANYAATKAGVMGLARSLSSEVASRGITVNVIAPGLIDTDMTMELGDGRDALLSRVPLGRIGNVSDVAGCAFFLASDESRYITGTVIRVDGGLAMGW